MSKLAHSSSFMESICRECAEGANLKWPEDTKGAWVGLCQSCGENEGTLIPMDDMEAI